MAGKFEVKAGQHLFKSGEQVVAHLPILPLSHNGKFNLSVQLTDAENIPHKNKAYFAVTESGGIIEGITDSEGYTKPIYTEKQENISFHLVDKYTHLEEEETWQKPTQD
ncbi:hypothetical protein [Acinetobacter stercoris]|uniref:Uncharacterized protein n=1 Tax=Acinetobacter stercoris TaxID=2126983 RepID=A0A2U3N1E3_9GAMM|nr:MULTISPECIES: hypothetical protein [Acinetobacter]SPL71497.1 hypothetical protein KPC_2675 [Acinetobacter stercoris]